MSTGLLGLPDELLDSVAKYLSSYHDYDGYFARIANLDSLSKACKRLHFIAEPYMYKSLCYLESNFKTRLLLRTLCERPRLAKGVKAVSLSLSSFEDCPRQMPPTAVEFDLFTAAVGTFCEHGSEPRRLLVRGLSWGCHSSELVILLALTTRVEALQITAQNRSFCMRYQDLGKCFEALFAPRRTAALASEAYVNLSSFTFREVHSEDRPSLRTASLESMWTVMLLPKLKSFTYFGVKPEVPDAESYRSNPIREYSSVEHVRLTNTNMDLTTLHGLLWPCKALKTLEISWTFRDNERDEDGVRLSESFFLDDFQSSMNRHQDTLTTLELTNVAESCDKWTFGAPIACWTAFTKLANLTIDETLLIGSQAWLDVNLNELLPPGLERLLIHCDQELGLVEYIVEAMASFEGRCLAHLAITFPWDILSFEERHTIQEYNTGLDFAGKTQQEPAIQRFGPCIGVWALKVRYGDGEQRVKFEQSSQAPMSNALAHMARMLESDNLLKLLEKQFKLHKMQHEIMLDQQELGVL